ncbi:unnamed protein product [Polarella glacialis]|uniref:Pentatricopeptide repeat-containing protein, chloroplastic n=1 Tax=Polarella glacialis TaxID=89957 RepID=A0A813HYB9_POLGL|nr:unnamed protein product [Polarella glacialis]
MADFRGSRLQLDVVGFSSVTSACEKGSQWERALRLLREMQAETVRPNVITYTAVINACGRGGQWRRAVEVAAEMRQSSLRPDTVCYQALASACERGSRWSHALLIVQEMRETRLRPSLAVYSVAVSACETGGLWQEALSLLSAMLRRRVLPNGMVFNSALSALERCSRWAWSLQLLQEAQQRRISLDSVGRLAALAACEQGMQSRSAGLVLRGLLSWPLPRWPEEPLRRDGRTRQRLVGERVSQASEISLRGFLQAGTAASLRRFVVRPVLQELRELRSLEGALSGQQKAKGRTLSDVLDLGLCFSKELLCELGSSAAVLRKTKQRGSSPAALASLRLSDRPSTRPLAKVLGVALEVRLRGSFAAEKGADTSNLLRGSRSSTLQHCSTPTPTLSGKNTRWAVVFRLPLRR